MKNYWRKFRKKLSLSILFVTLSRGMRLSKKSKKAFRRCGLACTLRSTRDPQSPNNQYCFGEIPRLTRNDEAFETASQVFVSYVCR